VTPAPAPTRPPSAGAERLDQEPVHLTAPGRAHRAAEAGRHARRLGGAAFAVVASGGALVVFVVMGVVGATSRFRHAAPDDGGAPDGWGRSGQLTAAAGTR